MNFGKYLYPSDQTPHQDTEPFHIDAFLPPSHSSLFTLSLCSSSHSHSLHAPVFFSSTVLPVAIIHINGSLYSFMSGFFYLFLKFLQVFCVNGSFIYNESNIPLQNIQFLSPFSCEDTWLVVQFGAIVD